MERVFLAAGVVAALAFVAMLFAPIDNYLWRKAALAGALVVGGGIGYLAGRALWRP